MKYRQSPIGFPPLQQRIALYPIVDSEQWVDALLKLNISTIQLRIKEQSIEHIEKNVINSIKLATQYGVQLFINDYWKLAMQHNAFGVHLGQKDIATADIFAIKKAGIRLGISTHSESEIENALSYHPSYIAFGPVYHTNTKKMPYKPQGLNNLKSCCRRSRCPVVAIGGMNINRIRKVLATGVDGVAVLSAIINSSNPVSIVNELLHVIKVSEC